MPDNNDDDILGSNMFSSMIPPVMPSVSDSFNVDDLVKRIDAKIAELEAEEQREKEANNSNIVVNPNRDTEVYEEKKVYDDETTDYAFFDDFFSDDN